MRTAVLCGQARPDGLGAIVFHGMWRGLAVLLGAASPAIPIGCLRGGGGAAVRDRARSPARALAREHGAGRRVTGALCLLRLP